MSTSLYTYSPADVSISWGGHTFVGVAEDTFITLKRSVDLVNKTVGGFGDVGLTQNADKTGDIEITLLQNSPTNWFLGGVGVGLENTTTRLPDAVGAMVINDPSGSVLAVAQGVWIQGYPEVALGATDQNSKTWMFGCKRLDYNATPVGVVVDLPTF